MAVVNEAKLKKGLAKLLDNSVIKLSPTLTQLLTHLSEETINGNMSRYKERAPSNCLFNPSIVVKPDNIISSKTLKKSSQVNDPWTNAKQVLDKSGPEAMALWVRSQTRVSLFKPLDGLYDIISFITNSFFILRCC
jgi:pyruvate carboxylase